MEKVFASVRFSSPLPVAVARTSQSPFPLAEIPLPQKRKLFLDANEMDVQHNSQISFFSYLSFTP